MFMENIQYCGHMIIIFQKDWTKQTEITIQNIICLWYLLKLYIIIFISKLSIILFINMGALQIYVLWNFEILIKYMLVSVFPFVTREPFQTQTNPCLTDTLTCQLQSKFLTNNLCNFLGLPYISLLNFVVW